MEIFRLNRPRGPPLFTGEININIISGSGGDGGAISGVGTSGVNSCHVSWVVLTLSGLLVTGLRISSSES